MIYSSLEEMPDEFELDEFIERLVFLQKIKVGLEQLGEGKKKTHQEVRQIVESWRKQSNGILPDQ